MIVGKRFLFILLFHSISILNAQDINLYWLNDLEEEVNRKVAFVSLSDNHTISDHPDSISFQELEGLTKEEMQYFKLEPEFRERFLTSTNIAKTDSLFIYDYSTSTLLSFSVKQLEVAVYLNMYENVENCPCSPYEYMFGFEIDKEFLKGLAPYYSHVLVSVGERNPFEQGKMKPVIWKKIDRDDFPVTKADPDTTYRYPNTVRADAYLFETKKYKYFLQDLVKENTDEVKERNLLVFDKKTGQVAAERVFKTSEGTGLADLNFGKPNEIGNIYYIQWTGKLFKNKPHVIFGFEWASFGCPRMSLIGSDEDIYINCDNRH